MKNFFTLDCIPTIHQMLPQFHRDRYQQLQLALEQLQQFVDFSSSDSHVDNLKLREAFAQARQIFTDEIANLSLDDLDPTILARIQSYMTEIDKQLQLLGVDLTFLQASRQPATVQARITQIASRLETLLGYTQTILKTQ